ncbi:MAG: hypothetical protein AAGB46_07835 [Verrucomicrobiota bacterium]
MSLINKALKKEQMKRTRAEANELPPFSAFQAQTRTEGPAGVPMRAPNRDNKNTLLLIGFFGVGFFLLITIGAFLYLGAKYLEKTKSPADTPSQMESQGLIAVSQTVEEPAIAPLTSATPNSSVQATPAEEPQPVSPVLTSKPEESSSVAEQAASKIEGIKESLTNLIATNKKEGKHLKIQHLIDDLKFQAVKSAGPNSKILMNGRVYRIGSTIDHQYGVVFKEAHRDRLIFVDDEGTIYEKFH